MITVSILNEVSINTNRSELYPSDFMFLVFCSNFIEKFGTASLAPGLQYLTSSGRLYIGTFCSLNWPFDHIPLCLPVFRLFFFILFIFLEILLHSIA